MRCSTFSTSFPLRYWFASKFSHMHTFEVWAPNANEVTLKLQDETIALKKQERGYWRTTVANAKPGDDYFYILDRRDPPFPDPRSAGSHQAYTARRASSTTALFPGLTAAGRRLHSAAPSFMNCTSAHSRPRARSNRPLKSLITCGNSALPMLS